MFLGRKNKCSLILIDMCTGNFMLWKKHWSYLHLLMSLDQIIKKWYRIKKGKRKYVSLILIYFIFFLLIPKRVGCQRTFGCHPTIFWRDVYILAQCFVLGYCLAIYCLAKQETVFVLLQVYWTCFVLIVVSHLKWEFPSCNMIGI